MVPVLFGVTLAVFSMLFLVPGDPVKMMLAEFVTNPDQVAQMRAQLHLDEPILKQYGRFVANAAARRSRHLDPEPPAGGGRDRRERRQHRASSPLASMAGRRRRSASRSGSSRRSSRNSWLDVGLDGAWPCSASSMPSFWLGLLLIFVFSLHLGWFPATGGGDLRHLVLARRDARA